MKEAAVAQLLGRAILDQMGADETAESEPRWLSVQVQENELIVSTSWEDEFIVTVHRRSSAESLRQMLAELDS